MSGTKAAIVSAAAGFLGLFVDRGVAGQFKIDGKTFTVPDGFVVEKVAGTPLVDRPIVADFDEQGRLYVPDSSGSNDKVEKQLAERPHRIVRLEDVDGDGRYDKSVVFADKMMFPEGAMWHDGSLYVAAPPSIWKLTDTDGDGVADQRVEWFAGKTLTGCANDLHGPYLGPDGWIYWCKGAFAEQRYEREGKKPFVTKAAHIFRARVDGTGIEPVMTGGMDNPVEVAFSATGERFFTTTFFQHPGGGQRDGLIHAIYGGVYGKVHDVIEGHVRTSAEVMPVLSHLGPAAPSGLMRYESGAFGAEYRDNLFAALFNLHKVTRHVLTPEGATFVSRDQDFLVCDSLDFHPTDVLEDADGSLLVIDTGGWYKLCCPTSQLVKPDVLGGIYRVRRADGKRVADPRGLNLPWKTMAPGYVGRLLGDARPAVRKRAIGELSRQGVDGIAALRVVLAESRSRESKVDAVWAASRIDGAEARAFVRDALKDRDEAVRQSALHSVSVRRDREAAAAVASLLNDESLHVRRAAAEAIGRIGDGRAVPALFAALATPTRVMEHSLTYAILEIGDADATAAGLKSGDPGARRAAMVALDQMDVLTSDVVARALEEPDATVRETARWIAGRRGEWGGRMAGVLIVRLGRPDVSEEEKADVRKQLARLAKSSELAQAQVADRAGDETLSAGERMRAMEVMRQSGVRDVPAGWVSVLGTALKSEEAQVVSGAVATARALPLKKEVAQELAWTLVEVAGRAELPANVRIDALAAVPGRVVGVDDELFGFVAGQLDATVQLAQRMAAAEAVGRVKLSDGQLKRLAILMKSAGPLEVERLLGAFEGSTDEAVGLAMVGALREAKSLKSVRPDAIRKRIEKFPQTVRVAGEALLAESATDAGKQKAKLEELLATLPAGDVRRGQILFNSDRAACATCHAIGYLGGQLGPDLTRIGAVRQERDLLESIVFPSMSFVQSYEPVMVDTKGNDRLSGILRRDDAEGVLLLTGPTEQTWVKREDVKSVRPGELSVMPGGLDEILTKQELADLVAFLKACR